MIREILFAILFSSVVIHLALIPTSNPIKRLQKNLANARPIRDFLQVCVIHFFCAYIVCDAEHQWMRIISHLAFNKSDQGSTIIDDYRGVFEAIYGYESLVLVVSKMQQSLLNYFACEWQTPPKFKSS